MGLIQSLKVRAIRSAIKKELGAEMFDKIVKSIDGHKMQITALLVALRGLAESYGINIPPVVDSLLAAFGIVAAKSAIKKAEPK
jgi:hypothetical protein